MKTFFEKFDKYFCPRCESIRSVCFHKGTKKLKMFIRQEISEIIKWIESEVAKSGRKEIINHIKDKFLM